MFIYNIFESRRTIFTTKRPVCNRLTPDTRFSTGNEQRHLFQNNRITIRVSITGTNENVKLTSQLINVVSEIPRVSDFVNERLEMSFSNGWGQDLLR